MSLHKKRRAAKANRVNNLVWFLIYKRYMGRSAPSFSSDDNNQAWKPFKTNTALSDRLTLCCAMRGRGWQAAVTVILLPHKLLLLVKLQASPGWSLLPGPYSLHPSIELSFSHLSVFFLIVLPLLLLFFSFLCYTTFPFPLISSPFTLHFQSLRSFLFSFFFPPPFLLNGLREYQKIYEGSNLIHLVLSALVAGHTVFYDFALNSLQLHGISGAFRLN